MTHGPKPETLDTLFEMELADPGETWTVTVTPIVDDQEGEATTARLRILDNDPETGAPRWIYFE